MTDPTNVFAMDDIKFMTGFNVEPVVASESAIGEAITRFYGGADAQAQELSKKMKELLHDEEAGVAAGETEAGPPPPRKTAQKTPAINLGTPNFSDSSHPAA